MKGSHFIGTGDYNYFLYKIPTVDEFLTATGITDPALKTIYKRLFDGVYDNNLQSRFKGFYPFATALAAAQKYNFLTPEDTDLAHRIAFQNDALSAHTAKGFVPNAAGLIYGDLNYRHDGIADIHISVYNSTAENPSSSVNTCLMKVGQAENDKITLSRNLSGTTQVRIGSTSSVVVSAAAGYDRAKTGWLLGNRSANAVKLYDDALEIATGTDSTTMSPHTGSTLIGAASPGSGTTSLRWFSQCAISFASIGLSMTPTQVTAMNGVVHDLNTSVNRL
ncbi:hypothetical protein GCM10023149_54140 [Mucilaginibacter gynuensis]|uniref:Uncharacterized protein n=1 Tax=Mucilaginibacter gynuensis TaxID=1302236 RepID=A0ABP8HNP8_9SPHI